MMRRPAKVVLVRSGARESTAVQTRPAVFTAMFTASPSDPRRGAASLLRVVAPVLIDVAAVLMNILPELPPLVRRHALDGGLAGDLYITRRRHRPSRRGAHALASATARTSGTLRARLGIRRPRGNQRREQSNHCQDPFQPILSMGARAQSPIQAPGGITSGILDATRASAKALFVSICFAPA
jgi:hypothetical protein